MFSMTKSRELDEAQMRFYFVSRRYYGENVKFYPHLFCIPPIIPLPLFASK